ncbi:MAG: hypothetical protein ACOZNI_35080 [Myxococcota bacterium]
MRLLPVLLLLVASGPVHASDGSGDASAGSGDASGDSAGASQGSADASGNSADSSANSSDPAASTVASSEGTSPDPESTLVLSVTGSGSSTTAGGVILTVVLARRGGKDEPPDPATEAAALLRAGLVAARRDVGLLLEGLATSPVLFDQLEQEAERGEGAQLGAVARTLRAPPAEVARAFVATRDGLGAPRDQTGAARFALDFLRAVAPAMEDDPLQAGAVLWQLARERRDPAFPRTGPAHALVARWMGVPVDVVVAASEGLPDRGDIYDAPLPTLDGLAGAIAARAPDAVHARVAAVAR